MADHSLLGMLNTIGRIPPKECENIENCLLGMLNTIGRIHSLSLL